MGTRKIIKPLMIGKQFTIEQKDDDFKITTHGKNEVVDEFTVGTEATFTDQQGNKSKGTAKWLDGNKALEMVRTDDKGTVTKGTRTLVNENQMTVDLELGKTKAKQTL